MFVGVESSNSREFTGTGMGQNEVPKKVNGWFTYIEMVSSSLVPVGPKKGMAHTLNDMFHALNLPGCKGWSYLNIGYTTLKSHQ